MTTALGGVSEGTGTTQGSNGGDASGAGGSGSSSQGSAADKGGASTGGGAGGNGSTLGGTNGAATSWRDSLPDDLKGDPTLAKYSDVANLAKAYLHAQQAIGKKGIIKPAANATPEEWKSFREALGVPSADKYEVSQPKGFEFPKETMDWAKKTFAEIGILPEDAGALMHKFAEFEVGRDKTMAQARADASKQQIEGLQKEWGENYGAELKRGLFAVQQLGEMAGVGKDKAIEWINKGAGNDPTFIKIMSAAAKLFKEDTLRENGIAGGATSASELDNSIRETQGQLIGMKKEDPRRPGVLAKFESLNRQRTGGR